MGKSYAILRGSQLLAHPTIPAPFHRVAPRNFLTETSWRILRQRLLDLSAKMSATESPSCEACGAVQRAAGLDSHTKEPYDAVSLNIHEQFVVDYANSRVMFSSFHVLCQDCHDYVHIGRTVARLLDHFNKTTNVSGLAIKKIDSLLKTHELAIWSACNIHSYKLNRLRAIVQRSPAHAGRFDKLDEAYHAALEYERRNSTLGGLVNIEEFHVWRMQIADRQFKPKYKTFDEWMTNREAMDIKLSADDEYILGMCFDNHNIVYQTFPYERIKSMFTMSDIGAHHNKAIRSGEVQWADVKEPSTLLITP